MKFCLMKTTLVLFVYLFLQSTRIFNIDNTLCAFYDDLCGPLVSQSEPHQHLQFPCTFSFFFQYNFVFVQPRLLFFIYFFKERDEDKPELQYFFAIQSRLLSKGACLDSLVHWWFSYQKLHNINNCFCWKPVPPVWV